MSWTNSQNYQVVVSYVPKANINQTIFTASVSAHRREEGANIYHIMINISSAFLHAGDQVDKVGLVVMQEGRREIVVSGCGRDY